MAIKRSPSFCVLILVASILASPAVAQRTFEIDILSETFGFNESTKKSVDLADLNQGCPQRDCIPSIDSPKYVAATDASHVADDDIVLALSWKGHHRAWPARILDHHEIVNDVIEGTPMAITWCPLCGSAVGVLREVNGQTTEFGVSGVLYNSDLVFYDRATETLWDQIEAKGIVGPLTGTKLDLVPITMTRWGKWKTAHPDTLVLSTDTGFEEDYSQDAYAEYREGAGLMFPVASKDESIHPKSVVFGFVIEDQKLAVTESYVARMQSAEHTIGGRLFSLKSAADGTVTLTDSLSGDVYSPTRLYWFAWFTFHPETELIE